MVEDTVIIGRQQGDTTENLLMEIKSLKFAHNKEFSDCVQGVVPCLLAMVTDIANDFKTGSVMVRTMNAAKSMFVQGGWGWSILKPLLQETYDGVTLIE